MASLGVKTDVTKSDVHHTAEAERHHVSPQPSQPLPFVPFAVSILQDQPRAKLESALVTQSLRYFWDANLVLWRTSGSCFKYAVSAHES